MNGESPEAADTEASPGPEEPAVDQEINLQALAEKVYALLKRELKVEQERQGRRNR